MPNLQIESDDGPRRGTHDWWLEQGFDDRGSDNDLICLVCGSRVSQMSTEQGGFLFWRRHLEWHEALGG